MLSPDFDFCEQCQILKKLDEEQVRKELSVKDEMYQDMIIGSWMFHSDEASKDLVEQIFIQGDSRYWSKIDNAEDKVASFIYHDAINIQRIEAPNKIEIQGYDDVTDPQKEDKERAIAIMKSFGYSYQEQEVKIRGGIADVLMLKNDIKAIVECRSVTVSKGIECLVDGNTELWIFAKDCAIYKLTCGKHWTRMYEFNEKYEKYRKARIWKSLLESITGEANKV